MSIARSTEAILRDPCRLHTVSRSACDSKQALHSGITLSPSTIAESEQCRLIKLRRILDVDGVKVVEGKALGRVQKNDAVVVSAAAGGEIRESKKCLEDVSPYTPLHHL